LEGAHVQRCGRGGGRLRADASLGPLSTCIQGIASIEYRASGRERRGTARKTAACREDRTSDEWQKSRLPLCGQRKSSEKREGGARGSTAITTAIGPGCSTLEAVHGGPRYMQQRSRLALVQSSGIGRLRGSSELKCACSAAGRRRVK
jgi:hypothetical protein